MRRRPQVSSDKRLERVEFGAKLSEALPYLRGAEAAEARTLGALKCASLLTFYFRNSLSTPYSHDRPLASRDNLLGGCRGDTFEHISASVCSCP